MVIVTFGMKKKVMKMTKEELDNLCDKGYEYAHEAYYRADAHSAEEMLSYCFEILFTLLKNKRNEKIKVS